MRFLSVEGGKFPDRAQGIDSARPRVDSHLDRRRGCVNERFKRTRQNSTRERCSLRQHADSTGTRNFA
jgi:hypothetical protein